MLELAAGAGGQLGPVAAGIIAVVLLVVGTFAKMRQR